MATTKQEHGVPISATSTGTTSTSASIAGVPNQTIYITDIAGSSSNPSGTITVLSGSTVLWQAMVGASHYDHSFIQPLTCAVGATCSVVTAGTVTCYANLSGFILTTT